MPKKFPDGENGWFALEDPTCEVVCSCGFGSMSNELALWISNYDIVRCPKCGRGYKTEFVVWVYEKDEDDTASIEGE